MKTRSEAECFICDKTRFTSVLNDLRIGEVILKIGSVWTEKLKVKVYANEEKCLSNIKTLIKNVFLLNFLHELLTSF